jgi:hypothetical protein
MCSLALLSCRCLLFGRPADGDLAVDLEAAGAALAAQILELPVQHSGADGSALPPVAAELCAVLAAANGEVMTQVNGDIFVPAHRTPLV